MFIVWGTKVLRKKSGVAADFCSICRGPVVVDVEEIRRQPHLYYVGLGAGQVVGHACRCQKCKTDWAVQAGTVRGAVIPSPGDSLETLILQTFPRFDVVYGERIEQEAAIRRNPFAINPEMRLSLIAEPFFLLEGDVQAQSQQNNTWQHNVGLLAGVAAFFLGLIALCTLSDNFPPIGFLEMFAAIGLAALSFWLSVSARKRFMDTRIYPRMAMCLAPLRPSAEELTQVLRRVNTKCAKQTKLQELLPLLDDARTQVHIARPAMADV